MDDILSLKDITADDFKPYQNTAFTITLADGQTTEIVLSDVRSVPGAQGFREPFSLTLSGAAGVVLPQSIYRFSHPEMGVLEFFIVPIAADAQSTTYEAVFS